MQSEDNFCQNTNPIKEYLDSDRIDAKATKILLVILALGAVVFVGALAPGICIVFKNYRRGRCYSKKQICRAVYNLQRSEFINITKYKDGRIGITLTPKGKKKANEEALHGMKITKPAKWDGKWRVLIFDIPVRFRKAREAFRFHVKRFGCKQLQKSVWAYPHPCEEELLFVAKFFGVVKYIEILTVDKMLNGFELREKFRLSGVKL